MEKPKLHVITKEYYDYHEVRNYLVGMKIVTETHARKHWQKVCQYGDIHNGCYFWINTYQDEIKHYDEEGNDYVYDFLKAVQDLLGEGEFKFWVEW